MTNHKNKKHNKGTTHNKKKGAIKQVGKKNGGGIFSVFQTSPISKAQSSESNFLSAYEDYIIAKKEYDEKYDAHLANLITLDTVNKMGSSFVDVFKTILMPNDFDGDTEIDIKNPLLLKSYLLSSESRPEEFRKQHMRQQVLYQIHQLKPEYAELFKTVNVKLSGKKVITEFVMKNSRLFIRELDISRNYIIDPQQIEYNIRNIISIVGKSSNNKKIPTRNSYKIENSPVIFKGNNTRKINNYLNKSKAKFMLNATKKNNSTRFNQFIKPLEKTPVELPTGNNKPLSKQQILQFQQQQVLPVEKEKNESGREKIVYEKSVTDEIKDLLGLGKKNNNKKVYNNIPVEKLAELDFSKITDKTDLDKICQRLSDREDDCKKIDKCWYNPKGEPKCYRFKSKNEI